VVVELFHVWLTSVVEGATIQATPPALQIILLPSGKVVPSGHAIAKAFIASGVATHQSEGPNTIAIKNQSLSTI